jgi:putative glutamine amidotransferase
MPIPVVAITATSEIIRDALRVRVNAAYVRAVEQAGLTPLVVPPLADPGREAGAVLGRVDGLLLTGGEDVAPARYGASPHPALGAVHEGRDATELALVAEARRRDMPVLAICRGIQLLNVALGGTLVQDIAAQRPSEVAHDVADRAARVHAVTVAEGSRLREALGAPRLLVNSLHHQAVDRVAEVLRVTARAEDGLIEGLEAADDGWWALAVQWHPEELVDSADGWDRGLFAAFARRLRSGRGAPAVATD